MTIQTPVTFDIRKGSTLLDSSSKSTLTIPSFEEVSLDGCASLDYLRAGISFDIKYRDSSCAVRPVISGSFMSLSYRPVVETTYGWFSASSLMTPSIRSVFTWGYRFGQALTGSLRNAVGTFNTINSVAKGPNYEITRSPATTPPRIAFLSRRQTRRKVSCQGVVVTLSSASLNLYETIDERRVLIFSTSSNLSVSASHYGDPPTNAMPANNVFNNFQITSMMSQSPSASLSSHIETGENVWSGLLGEATDWGAP